MVDSSRLSASSRPHPGERAFTSVAVERAIDEVSGRISGSKTRKLFQNCLPNTLDTTVRHQRCPEGLDTFVITGDIEAMWLRDSSAQVWPYLSLLEEDDALSDLVGGVIARQARCVLIDPYANAFNPGLEGSEWASDLTDMRPELHERKWEIDSLCYVLRLSYGFWRATGRTDVFDSAWRDAARSIIETFRVQQRLHSPGPYRFMRKSPTATDTAPGQGWGNPTRPNGMIHSLFRPSDDACIYPFLVPSNLFAITELRHLAEMLVCLFGDTQGAEDAALLADEVEAAVRAHAIVTHPIHGQVYAYEVDGFGNALFMDDANVPSLLSLPYLGCCPIDDATYQRTRRLILSDDNPYFFRGTAGEGIGGPHIGLGYIWPMGIILRALTSNDDAEIAACLKTLVETDGGTGFMHESFHKDDPEDFTRSWFAWANTLFGELILRLDRERPHLLKGTV